MIIDWSTTSYPTSVDSFTPRFVDGVHEVMASHPNSLASAIEAVETKLGKDGDPILDTGGLCLDPTGFVASPGPANTPTVWLNRPGVPAGILYFTDSGGVEYDLTAGAGGEWIDNIISIDVGDSPYAPSASDQLIECETSTGSITIDLPAGVLYKYYIVKDIDGSASSSNIIVNPNGAETIDGSGSATISIDDGFLILYFDGTSWKVLSKAISSSGVPVVDPFVFPTNVAELKTALESNIGSIIILDDITYTLNSNIAVDFPKQIIGTGVNSVISFTGAYVITFTAPVYIRGVYFSSTAILSNNGLLKFDINSDNSVLCGNKFLSNYVTGSTVTLSLIWVVSSGVILDGNNFYGDFSSGNTSTQCVYCSAGSYNTKIVNNSFFNSVTYMFIRFLDTGCCAENNRFYTTAKADSKSIYLDGANYTRVIGNSFNYTAGVGNSDAVAVYSTASDRCIISNNVILRDTSGTGYNPVIHIASTSNDTVITGNSITCINLENAIATPTTGTVYVVGGSTVLSNNIFYIDNSKCGVFIDVSSSFHVINNNVFYNFSSTSGSAYGVYIHYNSGSTDDILSCGNHFKSDYASSYAYKSAGAISGQSSNDHLHSNMVAGSTTLLEDYDSFPLSYVDVYSRVVTITAATYSVKHHDDIILIDASSNAVEVSMLAFNYVPLGKVYTFKRIDDTLNGYTVSIAGFNSVQHIEGVDFHFLANQYDTLTIMRQSLTTDATTFWVII